MNFFLVSLVFAGIAQAKELRGIAKSLDGKKHLYSEVHQIETNEKGLNQKITSQYLTPEGKVFAQMTSDFSKNLTLPSIQFEDLRFDRKEELNLDLEKKKIVMSKTLKSKKTQNKSIPYEENMVAGQGFDNFIKLSFDKLSEKPTPLSFGVLSEMDFFNFMSFKKNAESPDKTHFSIRFKNFLLRAFVSDLLVEYDTTTKQLLSYRGLSNIPDDKDKSQNVFIQYEKQSL